MTKFMTACAVLAAAGAANAGITAETFNNTVDSRARLDTQTVPGGAFPDGNFAQIDDPAASVTSTAGSDSSTADEFFSDGRGDPSSAIGNASLTASGNALSGSATVSADAEVVNNGQLIEMDAEGFARVRLEFTTDMPFNLDLTGSISGPGSASDHQIFLFQGFAVAGFSQSTGAFDLSQSNLPAGDYTIELTAQASAQGVFGGSGSDGVNSVTANWNIEIIPAPSTAALLGLGGLIAGRRRR